MANLEPVTDATFTDLVRNADGVVVVDFWADWCGPCRKITPILAEIASEYADKGVKVYGLDTNTNTKVPMEFGVMSIPLVQVWAHGGVIKSFVGAKPKRTYAGAIEELL